MSTSNYPPGMTASDYAHVNGEGFEEDTEPLSACCTAEIIWGDICSKCKEHCGEAEE